MPLPSQWLVMHFPVPASQPWGNRVASLWLHDVGRIKIVWGCGSGSVGKAGFGCQNSYERLYSGTALGVEEIERWADPRGLPVGHSV